MSEKISITKQFAQRLAEKLREPTDAPSSRRAASLFYDVRPARIVGEWSRDAGAWKAKANFIVGDSVDASFEFDVAAPLALESETAPTAADATAFVVWRGRWELASTGGPTIFFDRVRTDWAQNADRNGVVELQSGASATSPLSKVGGELKAGTLVVCVNDGAVRIIQAECG